MIEYKQQNTGRFDLGGKRLKSKRNNYIVGIYVRLSRDDERAGESLSIENQKMLLTKFVAEKGWQLHDVYVDDGISGTTFERDGVQRLLADAKRGIINTIVVKDLSRFGRNYIQVGQYIELYFINGLAIKNQFRIKAASYRNIKKEKTIKLGNTVFTIK